MEFWFYGFIFLASIAEMAPVMMSWSGRFPQHANPVKPLMAGIIVAGSRPGVTVIGSIPGETVTGPTGLSGLTGLNGFHEGGLNGSHELRGLQPQSQLQKRLGLIAPQTGPHSLAELAF